MTPSLTPPGFVESTLTQVLGLEPSLLLGVESHDSPILRWGLRLQTSGTNCNHLSRPDLNSALQFSSLQQLCPVVHSVRLLKPSITLFRTKAFKRKTDLNTINTLYACWSFPKSYHSRKLGKDTNFFQLPWQDLCFCCPGRSLSSGRAHSTRSLWRVLLTV